MHDVTTLVNWDAQLLTYHLEHKVTEPGIVFARLIQLKGASKKVRKLKPRSSGQQEVAANMKELVKRIYGDSPVRHAEGKWSVESSDFLREHSGILKQFLRMRKHVTKVRLHASTRPLAPHLPSVPRAHAVAAVEPLSPQPLRGR